MIHHVSLELDEHDVAAEVTFWELLGFAEMTPPGALAERARWVQRDDVQLHLMYADSPSIPRSGHVAVIVDDYDAVLARLRAARRRVVRRAAGPARCRNP